MPDPTIYYRETNRMCADTVQVYMRIADGVVTEFSFDGYMSIVATGSTAIWGEHILGMGVHTILSLREKDIQDILQMEISPRRRNASII
jgi:NifU-like protein involved in Fe-S cluster formation